MFFDEFDAIGKERNSPFEHGEMKRVVNSFLQMWDNFEGESLILAATNHQHLLDPALWRRFDENILFVVSAGNYEDGRTAMEYLDEEETGSRYPNYLLNDSRVKIIDPATSALALTVGSLSLGQGSAHRWFAKTLAGFEEFPSPLTRTGPGVNGMIKPDLMEFGGDLTFVRGSGIVTDTSIGVITTEKDFLTEGLFRVEDGTSFSAAKVSHLAAKLWKEHPTATSNLIKALLTASAKIPEPEIRPPPLDKLDLKKDSAEEHRESRKSFISSQRSP